MWKCASLFDRQIQSKLFLKNIVQKLKKSNLVLTGYFISLDGIIEQQTFKHQFGWVDAYVSQKNSQS